MAFRLCSVLPLESWTYSRDCFRNAASGTLSSTELCLSLFIGVPLKVTLGKGANLATIDHSINWCFSGHFCWVRISDLHVLCKQGSCPWGWPGGTLIASACQYGFGMRANLRSPYSTESISNSSSFRLTGWFVVRKSTAQVQRTLSPSSCSFSHCYHFTGRSWVFSRTWLHAVTSICEEIFGPFSVSPGDLSSSYRYTQLFLFNVSLPEKCKVF